jgi:hypothetical protein
MTFFSDVFLSHPLGNFKPLLLHLNVLTYANIPLPSISNFSLTFPIIQDMNLARF